jgi:4'-phosphopantetheinyl transferase
MLATADDTWTPGPLRPLLAADTVHVWRADLIAVAEDLGELLCSEEHARAERIVNEREGELWRRSRGLLRTLLGRYLQRDPSALRFVTGEHGKPALAQDTTERPATGQRAAADPNCLSFNMSHSGDWALYAFSHAGAVGVDVELARRPVEEVAIAARMFGAAEAQRLQALDPANRQREFLRAWAHHEAELKCLGVGIGGADAHASTDRPCVVQLELGLNAGAAVASERQARALCRWDWHA